MVINKKNNYKNRKNKDNTSLNPDIGRKKSFYARVGAVQALFSENLVSVECSLEADGRISDDCREFDLMLNKYANEVLFYEDFDEEIQGYDWKVIKRSSDKRLLRDIVKGVIVRQSSIDHFIVMLNIKDWDKVDRVFACILRSAIYEILYRLKTPKIVAISEYTRVADCFFGKTHAKFINALLDRIVRTLRCREDECEIDFKSFHSLVENDNIT